MSYDSQSAIHLIKNQMFHERTKHINVSMHFIRDVIAQSAIAVKKIPAMDNPTDMMTKLVPIVKFRHYFDLIGVDSI